MDVLIIVLMKTPIYMGSLIMKDKENGDQGPLEFSLSSLSFSLPFFIIYNTLSARELRLTKSQNQ